jgi:hypothetical protein
MEQVGLIATDFRSAFHVWQLPIEVCLRLRAQSLDISGTSHRGIPATLKPRDALDIDARPFFSLP